MFKPPILLALLFFTHLVNAQAIYKSLDSRILGKERQIKIQLPRNYDTNTEKKYPVILVLDGDYLFEPFAGNVDYFSYWDEIPEAIVVGVNQAATRRADTYIDDIKYLPSNTGKDFFDFIGEELIPHINTNYRTSGFNVIAGHNLTANFANFYILRDDPLFQAYINLSTDLSPQMPTRLYQAFSNAKSHKWFYLATSSKDVARLQRAIEQLNLQLKTIKNENFHFIFDKFDEAMHYTLVGHGIPRALEGIFSIYRPITPEEYEKLKEEGAAPFEYLENKYDQIEDVYGVEVPVRLNDFLAIGRALEYTKQWDELEKLGNLALEQDPDSMLGSYFIARAMEESGKPEKAMHVYEAAYSKKEAGFITADFMLEKAALIKKDFGL